MECKETKKIRNPGLRPSCGFLRIKIENGKVQKTKPLFFVGNKVFVFLSLQVKHIKQTVHFIDNVGRCFSTMHIVEDDWTTFSKEMDIARDEILYHREQYPGNTLNSKLLQDIKIRQFLSDIHNRKCWLQYIIERLRYDNYVNMAAIGISEQELSEFIKMREKEIKLDKVEPDINYTPNINPDSITTIQMPY